MTSVLDSLVGARVCLCVCTCVHELKTLKNYFLFNNIGGGINSFSFYQIKGRGMIFCTEKKIEGDHFNEPRVIKLLLARGGGTYLSSF